MEDRSSLTYMRNEDRVRLTRGGFTNWELRCLMLALWWSMGEADRNDFEKELRYYNDGVHGLDDMPELTQDVIRGIES